MKRLAIIFSDLKKIFLILPGKLRKVLHRLKILLVLGMGLAFLAVSIFYIVKLIEPSSPVKNVFVSNVTDHQVSISWTTAIPTRGALIIAEKDNFPLLPLFTTIYRDDTEKVLGDFKFSYTHHATVGGLQPNKTYQFRIYQEWKKVYRGSFSTGPTLQSILNPNPVYGKILQPDRETPVAGAIVYLQVLKDTSRSALLSTVTNKNGHWSVDLANVRSSDLTSPVKISTNSAERMIVETGKKGKFKALTLPDKDQPWPDVILK